VIANSQRILLVGADRELGEALRRKLGLEGHEVVEAWTGADALIEIGRVMPDLALVDLGLLDVSGLDVCRYIRANQKAERPVIVMLSEVGEEVDRVVGLELGAADYVLKPFTPAELITRIRRFLTPAMLNGGAASDARAWWSVRTHAP
jgi:DNA-binding response OmpR family regulator